LNQQNLKAVRICPVKWCVIVTLSLIFGIEENRGRGEITKVIKRNKNEGVRTIKYGMHLI